ncbi:Yos1-domain-containing protein [Xylariaceae sp. FL0662B]|nr:Yos1-domain-containing protein [Xylariaceae sp. FL0662B]
MLLLGNLFYVSVLLVNAIAILSEDRFLARINLTSASHDPAFGAGPDSQSAKAKVINLIASVRTLMRSAAAQRAERTESQPDYDVI